MTDRPQLPLVYSCSGCSSVAQLANHLAIRLDHEGYAEMSCIAGVGGDVGPLVRIAKSGRPIIAIDGCALACVLHTLARHGVVPAAHRLLASDGIRKRYHQTFDPVDATNLFPDLRQTALSLTRQPEPARAAPSAEPAVSSARP
ncbi:MAG TPA: putative zinc-binding protein [Xanthobacteraceae bacterium]|nr:putative zinc-binding protein [Xanthobacteraceae bacterium]